MELRLDESMSAAQRRELTEKALAEYMAQADDVDYDRYRVRRDAKD